jgi:hypothetical protein
MDPRVREAAQDLAAWGGGSVRGVLFFGSRRSGAATDAHSAWDFFVAVDSYPSFYDGLRGAGAIRRSPAVFAALNAVMPPNQVAVRTSNGGLAKCAVISVAALERETGAGRRDHFCAGRLFQPAAIAHAADEPSDRRLVDVLTSAVRQTGTWGRVALPERFDADAYGREVLALSMSWEIRPEPRGRAEALWAAEREEMLPLITLLLDELAERGELIPRGKGLWSLTRRAGRVERLRMALYGRWSMARATVRWLKYVWTFEDWLDYILRKIERHTGQHMELTPRERRWPLVFLWPRMLRFLRERDRGADQGGDA